MPTDRGEYRPMFTRILNGPSFQALGSDARHVLHAIKLVLPAAGIAVLPGMVGQFVDATALAEPNVRAALEELKAQGWVDRERNVLWLIRGLEFEPTLNHQNEKHRAHIQRAIKALPSLPIVDWYRAHYPKWFEASESPSDSPSEASRSTTPTPTPTPLKASHATHAAGAARVDNVDNGVQHSMAAVLSLVVEKLYFGHRPPRDQMAVNASVLKKLHGDGRRSWDYLARVVEGLALRRDRGELKSVKPTDPISCKWLSDKDQDLNQLAVSEDALYRIGPDPPPGHRRGVAMARIGS
ncbi:MAG: hypothetical protein ACREMZ_14390 [Gemmatimonadales bacterium]